MSYYYTIKEIADMAQRTKTHIATTIKELNIEQPDKKGANRHYYNAEHTKQILLKINPCYDTKELDREIFEMSAAAEEIDRTPTEQEQAEREFIIKQEQSRAEIAQQQMLIDMLKGQLTAKDKQIEEYSKQVQAKDEQIKDLLQTVTSSNKQIIELTSTIDKQAAAISQAQQLNLIAQAEKIKEMQRENKTETAVNEESPAANQATQQQQNTKKGGGAASETTAQSTKTAANMSFWEKVKFVFKK